MTISSVGSTNPPFFMTSASSPTPIDNQTVESMIYGALQAYEFDTNKGLTQQAEMAKQFLLSLDATYTFSDGYAQKTLTDFQSLVSKGGDIKAWWTDLKSLGLKSTDSSQPRLSLWTWTEQNRSNFNPTSLPSDNPLLTSPNFTNYTDMFFEQALYDQPSTDFAAVINSYFSQTSDASANAGALTLQLFDSFGQPEPGDPNWDAFAAAVNDLVTALDPSGQQAGMCDSLRNIASQIYPDPYTSFKAFYSDVETGTISPDVSAWSTWGTYEDDIYAIQVKDYQQFDKDLTNKNINAAVQDYVKIRSDTNAQDPTHLAAEQAMRAAADTWANSIDINVVILNLKSTGPVAGPSGDLGGTLLQGDRKGGNNVVTLTDYLNNPNQTTHLVLPEIDYEFFQSGELYKADGTTDTGASWPNEDDTYEPILTAAFNGQITWYDNNNTHGEYAEIPSATAANFMNDGRYNYFDASSGGSASSTAESTINQILTSTPH